MPYTGSYLPSSPTWFTNGPGFRDPDIFSAKMKPPRDNRTGEAPPHHDSSSATGGQAQPGAVSNASNTASVFDSMNVSQPAGTNGVEDTAGLSDLVEQDNDDDGDDETTTLDMGSDRTNPNVSSLSPPHPMRMDPDYYCGSKIFWCAIRGGAIGIFNNWDDAEEATSGFQHSTTVRFNSWAEAYHHYRRMYQQNKCSITQPSARALAHRLHQSMTPTLQCSPRPVVLVPPTPTPAPRSTPAGPPTTPAACTPPAAPATPDGENDVALRLGEAHRNPFSMPAMPPRAQHRQPALTASASAGCMVTPSPGQSIENPINVDMPTPPRNQSASNSTAVWQPTAGGTSESRDQIGVMNYTSMRLIEAYRQWRASNPDHALATTVPRITADTPGPWQTNISATSSNGMMQGQPTNSTGNRTALPPDIPLGLITRPGFIPNWTNRPAQSNSIHTGGDTAAAQPAQTAHPAPRIAEPTPTCNIDATSALQPPVPNWATCPTTPSQVQNCDLTINQPATTVSPPPRPSAPNPDAPANQPGTHSRTYSSTGVQTRTVFLLSALSSLVSRMPDGPIDVSSGSESGTLTSTASSTSSVPRKRKASEEAGSDLDSPERTWARQTPEHEDDEALPPTPPQPNQCPFIPLFPLEDPEDQHEFAPSPPGFSFFTSTPVLTTAGASARFPNDTEFDHLTDYGDEELFPKICIVLAETESLFASSQSTVSGAQPLYPSLSMG
ncbi:hypothetical protein CPB84DRAFT_1743226 [Gymnopilus junonius]|uniref:Ribonuclease H1 N-terminal domain-containing protein n=1 Tax=Gymnopilus junonius TaxID=109634 RepID=A0A9P5NW32_GYMJU|nr:hypothetical protein CPB84DRAFT_1743226 [Gymnopilus junonius]